MEKNHIIERYKNKILGVKNYRSEQREFRVEDFTDLDKLDRILGEINTGESDITPAGKEFIKQYYELAELSKELLKTKNQYLFREMSSPNSPSEIQKWLLGVEPMGTISFIEKAKGTITGEEELKDELLPPNF